MSMKTVIKEFIERFSKIYSRKCALNIGAIVCKEDHNAFYLKCDWNYNTKNWHTLFRQERRLIDG